MDSKTTQTDYVMHTIGVVHSCFADKFGVPRQPGLAEAACGVIELQGEYARADAVRGIEQFSHLWVVFAFHQTAAQGWRPLVRPPRLGGNETVGVFASRSTFRPNPVGLSVVRLERVEQDGDGIRLHICGLDLIEGTPVLDIKPYIRYSDQVPDANCGYADSAPAIMAVQFTAEAQGKMDVLAAEYPQLQQLITQVLGQDPRPAYHNEEPDRQYGMVLYDLDIHWRVVDGHCEVVELTPRA